MHTSTSPHEPGVRAIRRVFIVVPEIPGLLRGAIFADPVSIRRILGARRGGRFGALLALAALAPHVAAGTGAPTIGAHLALSLLGWSIQRGTLGPRQYQRVVLWMLAPALAVTAPLALFLAKGSVGAAALASVVAVLAAHARLIRYARRRAR